MKKTISSILAAIMAFSLLTVPAFAASAPATPTLTDEYFLNYVGSDDSIYGLAEYSKDYKEVIWSDGVKVISSDATLNKYRVKYGLEKKPVGWGTTDETATSISLPKSTVAIMFQTFLNRTNVTTVNFSDLTNLKYIGVQSFYDCKLTEVDLSKTQVVRIDDGAFCTVNYPTIQSFTSPTTLKKIGGGAFEGQHRLNTANLNEGLLEIGQHAFYDTGVGKVTVPSTVTTIGANAFNDKAILTVTKGSYAETWAKSNGYTYVYTDGSTTPTNPEPPVTPTTPAPKMEHTQKVGGVTFSNFVSEKTIDTLDYYNKPITVHRVEIGPNGCMRSDVDNTDFIYWHLASWNDDGKDGHYEGNTAGIYTDKGAWNGDWRTETLEMWNMTPYPTTKNSNGTWSKGLTWEFGKFITDVIDANDYTISVIQGNTTYYYYVKVVENPTYTTTPTTPTAPTTATAVPTTSKIYVDGKVVTFEAYNINNNNYFKLRDVAQILRGTKAQFEVTWNTNRGTIEFDPSVGDFVAKGGAIDIISGKAYTTVGGELKSGDGKSKPATLTTSPIYLNDNSVQMTAYTINGNNFFKLRDIGKALGFDVSWDNGLNAIVVNSATGYTED